MIMIIVRISFLLNCIFYFGIDRICLVPATLKMGYLSLTHPFFEYLLSLEEDGLGELGWA